MIMDINYIPIIFYYYSSPDNNDDDDDDYDRVDWKVIFVSSKWDSQNMHLIVMFIVCFYQFPPTVLKAVYVPYIGTISHVYYYTC